ncbi:MAG: type I-D CRISPR-associated helicase Cas3' [Cyanobacteriota bacterium]|nr:type I-D CRISPR-associated helicase Cas3' [Cyanobacteriota bacterium]
MNQKIQIKLEPKSISACASLPPELKFMNGALQHQVDVWNLAKNNDIILDLAPTGTGKTNASFTVLLHQPNKTAVYIAPTNALVTQQAEAAEKFVRKAGLPHAVKPASAKEISSWQDDKVSKRPGEKLYNVLRNPATIFPEVGANKPLLLVTNPDIFYYATFFAYNPLDRGNIASQFYSKFATVIFDEFHLYDAKQLVSLLFYLAVSHVLGFFKNGRRVILLTATPEPACERALETLEKLGVRIARINGEENKSNLLPSQTAVCLEIRPQLDKEEWLRELADEVVKRYGEKPGENGAVILDSKDLVNRLADLLKLRGFDKRFGRITGSTPFFERQIAVGREVILATNTVDVGFNFEKSPPPERQNLDWLIFSANNRFSFWQRLGRVGRVLGKAKTDVASEAIAYLPSKAWEEDIASLDCFCGRVALGEMLENLKCLDRPFLEVYWRSEAFLEIARPLAELEDSLQNLPEIEVIEKLYKTMQLLLGGKRDWSYYRYRIKVLRGAESLVKIPVTNIPKEWQYVKGGQALFKTFLKASYPAEWEEFEAGNTTLKDYEKTFLQDEEAAAELKKFAEVWKASYAPIFRFRDGLFESLKIRDPKGLLLDEAEDTFLEPFHLLRYYEFVEDGEFVELVSRAKESYQISFYLRYCDTLEEFKNMELNKLNAFENCRVERRLGEAVSPTPLLKQLDKDLLPGVIIATAANMGVIIRLQKQRIASYPISVSAKDGEKNYTFFPGLGGILAIALYGVVIKLADEEDFYIA